MKVVFNVKDMTIGQYKKFNESQKSNDFNLLIEAVMGLIISWDLPGKVDDLAYWDTLKLTQWKEISDQLGAELTSAFDTKK